MAVSSSIAYAGPDKPAAHRSAAAMVFVGRSGFSTCGKIENSTSPSASSPPSGGVQMTKSSPILGVITMLPALSPTQTVLERRQEISQSGLPHPVAQIQRVAAVHQQGVTLLDQGNPEFFVDAGQCGELQHSQGLPAQLDHWAAGLLSADEVPCPGRTGHGVPVRRGGNAEGARLGNRLGQ